MTWSQSTNVRRYNWKKAISPSKNLRWCVKMIPQWIFTAHKFCRCRKDKKINYQPLHFRPIASFPFPAHLCNRKFFYLCRSLVVIHLVSIAALRDNASFLIPSLCWPSPTSILTLRCSMPLPIWACSIPPPFSTGRFPWLWQAETW